MRSSTIIAQGDSKQTGVFCIKDSHRSFSMLWLFMLEGVLNTSEYVSKTHLSGSKLPSSVFVHKTGSPEHTIITLIYISESSGLPVGWPLQCVYGCVWEPFQPPVTFISCVWVAVWMMYDRSEYFALGIKVWYQFRRFQPQRPIQLCAEIWCYRGDSLRLT